MTGFKSAELTECRSSCLSGASQGVVGTRVTNNGTIKVCVTICAAGSSHQVKRL